MKIDAFASFIFEVFNRYPSTLPIKFLCPMATKLGQNVVLVTHLYTKKSKMVLGSMCLIVLVVFDLLELPIMNGNTPEFPYVSWM